jgi:hypothetical protein
MGAWGHGPFENDDASDWVWTLEESSDLSVVRAALDGVVATAGNYLEAPACSEALAAAEVVAALSGRPRDGLPDEVKAWIRERSGAPPEVIDLARQAVTAIHRKSELRELWQESDSFDDWSKTLDDLAARLAG